MERRYRLSRSKDFDAVYRQGRSVSTRFLTLHWFPRDDDPSGSPRLGLAVPKAVGNAVVRNRLKRQLRETWQELRPVILARRNGREYASHFDSLIQQLNAAGTAPEVAALVTECNKELTQMDGLFSRTPHPNTPAASPTRTSDDE